METNCYICGNSAGNSDQVIIEDGIPCLICLECGGDSCGPV